MSAWQDRAACAGHPEPDLWHHDDRGMTRDKAAAIRDAKEVCATCPVRLECLTYAVDNGFGGIWGGTTEHERMQTRKDAPKRRRAIENIAFVLEHHPRMTAAQVAERLGLEVQAINRAVDRAQSTKLRAQLDRNTETAARRTA